MYTPRRTLAIAAVAALGTAAPAAAQPAAAAHSPIRPSVVATAPARRPFAVGERLLYQVKYGPVRVGRGSIELTEVASVRGQPAWRAVFKLKGGNALYSLDNTFQSWIDTSSLASLRFVKDVRERGRSRSKTFEIFPERGVYEEAGKGERPTVDGPLDDASFFYFVRTVPLVVGESYKFDRYFKPDRNPVGLRVVRRERITVPAGTFDAVVVRPTIKTSGLLGESRKTEVWLSDDSLRLVLQVRSDLPFGSITMALGEYRAGGAGAAGPEPTVAARRE